MANRPLQFGAQGAGHTESLWLVALYESEDRIQELLERLRALGVETSDASIVRVELNDQQRAANRFAQTPAPLTPAARRAVTGAIVGSGLGLLSGLALYEAGVLQVAALGGLPGHSALAVVSGAALGALSGYLTTPKQPAPALPAAAAELMQELTSDGFLVAVKMPPRLGEQAETIARSLGAKQILC